METRLTSIDLTELASEGGDLLATVQGIYDDQSLTGFRIAAAFTMSSGTAAKPALELIVILQKP